jgi:multicomponent Na+:H+ antiporter subunit D
VSQVPVLIPTSLLLTALLSLLVGLRSRPAGYATAVLGITVAFGISVAGLVHLWQGGETIRYALGNWLPPLGIEFVFDTLAAYMVAIILFVGALVVAFARHSLALEAPGKEGLAWPAMALVLAGLTGMCLTGDLFNLYVFLEIAAIAAYALLAIGSGGGAVATFRYLLIGAVGGGFYLIGVAFLYFSAGTLNMADMAMILPELSDSRAVQAAGVFMVAGLAIKMALFPFHFWLPDVYTNAPSPVAGLIAPVMTKVSAYAIIRLFLDVFPPGFFTEGMPLLAVLGWVSAAGILYGSILAIGQQDYRRMLAYSSVGQLGYIGLGVAMANPLGMIGALLHVLNHALMKGLLFLVGGVIFYRCGRTRIPDFQGVGRKMPWTLGAFTIGALAMVGIPPTAGFFSKWYLLLGAADAQAWTWFAVIVASSLLSAVYFFRVLEIVWRNPDVDPAAQELAAIPEGKTPPSMFIPVAVLSVAILLAGLLNVAIIRALLDRVVAPLAGGG